MDLSTYLSEKQKIIESELERSISNKDIPPKLYDSMRYSLLAGGKRLRPILSLAAAEAVGQDPSLAMPFGIAVEMIHTFSLIHDDLPAMDDDDLRRGKPTNHKIYGEAIAVLAGDGLLAEAIYYLLSNARLNDEKRYLNAARLLIHATGARGMTGGQVLDMEAEDKSVGLKDLEKLHSLKTGALIAASVVGGAMLAGANEDQLAKLDVYGKKLGLAFQVMDDILDIEGDESLIGKPVGSDVNNKKSTYPKIMGIEKAKMFAGRIADEAIESLTDFSQTAWPLRELATYVINRKK